jgi:transcription antitermination protein NusB
MQSVYALLNASEDLHILEAKKHLNNNFDQNLLLATANFLLAKNICEFCIIDANQRSAKHLPSAADLQVSLKSSQNKYVVQLIENFSFNKVVEENKLYGRWSDKDIVKKLYQNICESKHYASYIETPTHDDESDRIFFKYVLQTISTHEDAQALLEDLFINFEEDKTVVDEWILENVEHLPKIDFGKLLPNDKRQFGLELLATYIDKQDVTLELIKPKLINWEADRIAMMDMIILQLGITELLYFPNIPSKVSINEYIDLAKQFSTLQSGQFVNGVLDKIHKELMKDNKLFKEERPIRNKN